MMHTDFWKNFAFDEQSPFHLIERVQIVTEQNSNEMEIQGLNLTTALSIFFDEKIMQRLEIFENGIGT